MMRFQYSQNSVEHAMTAWKAWVENSDAQKIYVVAHSRGGADISEVVRNRGKSCEHLLFSR